MNDLTPQKQTCLHITAEKDHSAIATVLLENKIKFDVVDDALNNGEKIKPCGNIFLIKSSCCCSEQVFIAR